ncbi:DNA helicase-2 / ATP-dependent DNA helicase PcrA [Methanolobus vulcani]|uniref:DNA 3'-5' helicase n=1 Tax=Methanolobus vulcani TaxID=38026 RepID=A0A7Z7AX01_9EURY|nr:ATP-dependent helicase [Methanolobus vulcani]SDF93474.1 DNA helicase-2 / ATP-dependent DNA helicase PcrA [Methanolobus vulcani]
MISLSPEQNEIVNAPIGQPMRILASAGSGKTRVLTERIRHILKSTKKEGIIALTFTNKAAEEMQYRLENCENIEERVWIATIHSVAQRVLEQYGHTIGLPSELQIYEKDEDRMEVFMQSLREEGIDIDEYLNVDNSREQRNREKNLQRYMNEFSLIKRDLLTEEDIVSSHSENLVLWEMYQDYQNALLNSGGIDYDDILVYAHQILLTHEWIGNVYRAKYKHVCVDEGQDLNRAQYEFIKALCGETIKSVLIVGDPDQMIYGFNGSSIQYLCKQFDNDFSPIKFKLNKNYRSSEAVISAANKLKPQSQVGHEYALKGQLIIKALDDENAEANWIVEEIKNLLHLRMDSDIEGEITLDKMVIIARNRFIFSRIEQALTNNGIIYSIRKGERNQEPESLFGKILDHAIRIKLNSKDWVNGKKLCNLLNLNPPTKWGQDDLLNTWAQQISTIDQNNSDLYSTILRSVNEWDVSNPNIPKFVRDFERKLKELADSLPINEDTSVENPAEELKRSLDELNEFSESWIRFKRKGTGDSLSAFRNAIALGQIAKDVNENGITLSTVHTMKGLEKDIVFLMGMCDGVFPDYRANTQREIEEERNNAFVAITRAKRWLYITYPKKRVMPWGDERLQRPSRFLVEIQE